MRLFRNIICLMFLLPMVVMAQNNKNLSKVEIGKINREVDGRFFVKQGEFKIDFENKIYDDIYGNVFKYFVIIRDGKGKANLVMMNNHFLNFTKFDYPVDIVRAGFTIPEYDYIEKRNSSSVESGKYKYYLNVGGIAYGPYDAVTEILPDGFVYRNKDVYTYRRYDSEFEGNRNYCILEKDKYHGDYVQCSLNDKVLKFSPKKDVDYYKSYEGHYYILYNDNLMENSLLIVDGVGHELEGAENKLLFSFSHNGEHWIAASRNYIVVDGITMPKINGEIKKVVVTDDGEYAYVVDSEGYNERLFVNDKEILCGAEVLGLTVDDNEKFNYLFRNDKGYFYGIGNDVKIKNDDMKVYYYPALLDVDQTFTVKSNDGKHTFVYSYNLPYIMIDGERIDCPSIPHYAIWSESEKSFKWNAVEDIRLVVYKFKVKKK